MKWKLVFVLLLAMGAWVNAAIKTQAVEYKDGDTRLVGYLAFDDAAKDKRPGIVVVPEWWGLNDYVKMRARLLAQEGYIAFVADIYGEGFTTTDPKVAGEKAGASVQTGQRLVRSKLALEQLKANPQVDVTRLAGIGYCFGGSAVLDLARSGENLKCVVSFHGALKSNIKHTEAPNISAKVLVCHGADDKFISPDEMTNFIAEMNSAKADWVLIQYCGAVHAFTNPEAGKFGIPGVQYNENADKRSWQHMKDMFAEALK